MQLTDKIVDFALNDMQFALYLRAVERIYRLVEITPLPQAPAIVSGLVNIQGRVIPVVNVRKRFHLPEREPDLSDKLILAHTAHRPVALIVDDVGGVREIGAGEMVGAGTILPATEYVAGVVKLAEGLILIHDLDTFLSLEEERDLGAALQGKASG